MKNKLLPLFFFIGSCLFAQNQKIDSLLTLLKTDKEDTNKATHLYKLCDEYKLVSQYDKGLNYGKQALMLSQTLAYKKGIAKAYNLTGLIYMYQGNYALALQNAFSALKTFEEIKDNRGLGNTHNTIGSVYLYQNNYPLALQNFTACLKIYQQMKNKLGIAQSYNNIGIVYFNQNNYPLALQNYIAALKIQQEVNQKLGIANAYLNIGAVYVCQNNFPLAEQNALAALKIYQDFDDKDALSSSYINLAQIYIKQTKTKQANVYLNQALQLGFEVGSKDAIKDAYLNLAVLDSITANYKAAYQHYKLYIAYRDSLNNEETKKKTLQTSMQYEFDKKEIATKAQQEKLDAINAEEKQKQRVIIYAVAGLLLLVGVFAVFIYNRFRITHKQKQIIEEQKVLVDEAYEQLHEKNKEVMDSIHYAKRIQTALITSEKYIASSLNKLMKS